LSQIQEKKPEPEQARVQVFQEMERRDENQILAELRGDLIEEFVYSINVQGRTVTNLSYAGVKEAIRRKGHVEILDFHVEQDEKEYKAVVRVRDHDAQIDVLGASTAEREKPFAWTLAINKSERNAFMKLLPAKWIASTITEYLGRNKPQPAGTKQVTESPVPAKQSPEQAWKVPLTKDQATHEQVQQGVKQHPLLKGVTSFGMLNVLGAEASLVPEQPVVLNSPLIDGFLVRRVLEPMKAKHEGFSYEIKTDKEGKLHAILIRNLQNLQINELVNAARWAFQRALEPRPEIQPWTKP
jgi:hypothetical protein